MAFQTPATMAQGAHLSSLNFDKTQEVEVGQFIDFAKENPTCTRVRAELFWSGDQDGDVSVLLLDQSVKALKGTIPGATSPNQTRGMVWYNNLAIPGVSHSGDALTSNDDASAPEETIKITLSEVDPEAQAVVLVASTYPDKANPTVAVPFTQLRNARALIINDDTNEVLYSCSLDRNFGTFSSVEVCEFSKNPSTGSWEFVMRGAGVGSQPQGLADIASKYNL